MTGSKRVLTLWLMTLSLALAPLALAPQLERLIPATTLKSLVRGRVGINIKAFGTTSRRRIHISLIHVTQPWAANPNGMIDIATSTLFESGNLKLWDSSTHI